MIGILLISGFLSCNQKKDTTDQRPNIVLIMGDDIGFSDLGCYGSEIPTPNLDKFANQGIRFKQFYNMSKCETTRSVLLTGHYTGDHRSVSLGRVLRDAGYYTIHSGKEHFKKWVPKSIYAENEQKELDLEMAVFAAMVYRMD